MSFSAKLALATLVLLASLTLIGWLLRGNSLSSKALISPKIQQSKKPDPILEKIIKKNLENIEGDFAVGVYDLKADESFFLNEKRIYKTGSFYKLVLLAVVFDQIEKGLLSKETNISSTKSHLIEVFGDIDFGYENSSEEISYTIGQAIKRLSSISDNFASIMLSEKVRNLEKASDPLQNMAEKLGMDDTNFTDFPQTTIEDMIVYFKLLYEGKIVSKTASLEIIDLLSSSRINNRIPAKLPKEVKGGTISAKLKIAHKTAELSRLRHDGGIVFLPDNPYIIVLMSGNLKYEDDGVEALANISKDVFEYFEKK